MLRLGARFSIENETQFDLTNATTSVKGNFSSRLTPGFEKLGALLFFSSHYFVIYFYSYFFSLIGSEDELILVFGNYELLFLFAEAKPLQISKTWKLLTLNFTVTKNGWLRGLTCS